MHILGVSALFHDAAACLVRDGEIIGAVQEERLTRVKHDPRFPVNAIATCLDIAGITIDDVDRVAFYEKPHLKFERILAMYARSYPQGFETFAEAIPLWLREKAWTPGEMQRRFRAMSPTKGQGMRWDGRTVFPEHHLSHAASAFFPSPFDEAAILTLDGVGEWATTTLALGRTDGRGIPRIEFTDEIRYPDSLGMLYSAFTSYLGFKVNSGEYKVMGLAPYGQPDYAARILDNLIDVRDDGSFQLNLEYFTFHHSTVMVNEDFHRLFGVPPRDPESPLQQQHFDIAASVQRALEEVVVRIARHLRKASGMRALCMAGGVALNCVANGIVHREGIFDDIWVQPAAGDAGGALGAALYVWHEVEGQRRVGRRKGRDMMRGALLGPSYDASRVVASLKAADLPYSSLEPGEAIELAADMLAREEVIGWFQGRMEFGPRSLGARSILGDPRSPATQRVMNLKVKYRESFRPFAPAVLRERVNEWFDLDAHPESMLGRPGEGYDSPYMLLVAPVRPERQRSMTAEEQALFGIDKLNVARSEIPACTHVDYSARIQTVARDDDPRFHALLSAFYDRTGVPVVVNTSFNIRGEPIVCTPEDAIRCFLGTDLDALFMDDVMVRKSDVPVDRRLDYRSAVPLD